MTFENWLMESNIKFISWSDYGQIVVVIDGKRYVYNVDPMYYDNLKRIAKYRPGKALNFVKDLVNSGRASLEGADKPIISRHEFLFSEI